MYKGAKKELQNELALRRRKLNLTDVDGEELKLRRNDLGFTQEKLAGHFGVERNTIARWENGVLTVPKWVDLALQTLERWIKGNKKKFGLDEFVPSEVAKRKDEREHKQSEKANAEKQRKLKILFGDD
jgi:transcriptional regulator with XRE-family HTH domain